MENIKNTTDIIDIDLSPIKKKKFRINGDNNKVLMLNVSDVGVLTRYQESIDKLKKLVASASDYQTKSADITDDEEMIKSVSDFLKSQNDEICKIIDYIFDSNVSEICCDGGTMYDPINGQYRFEYIIESLLKLYENNLEDEYKKLKSRVDKHTSKYTRKK